MVIAVLYRKNLELLRNRIGTSQNEMGNLINLDSGTYSHYEKEDLIIPLKHLITICNYFNVSLDYIFSFNDLKQYENIKKSVNLIEAGLRLKEFRVSMKKSQTGFCMLFNISRSSLSGYEIGKFLISTSLLYDICKKYKVSADYLLGRIDSPKYLK